MKRTTVKLAKIRAELERGFRPVHNPTAGYLHRAHGTGLEAASRERCKRARYWRQKLLELAGDTETVEKRTVYTRYSWSSWRHGFRVSVYSLHGHDLLAVRSNGTTCKPEDLTLREQDSS